MGYEIQKIVKRTLIVIAVLVVVLLLGMNSSPPLDVKTLSKQDALRIACFDLNSQEPIPEKEMQNWQQARDIFRHLSSKDPFYSELALGLDEWIQSDGSPYYAPGWEGFNAALKYCVEVKRLDLDGLGHREP